MPNKEYPSVLFENRIKAINEEVKDLFDIILKHYRKAIQLLDNYDEKIADEVVEKSKEIDLQGYGLERKCIRFIAVEQPLAGDLMYVESTIRIISHAKRIAYLSANIAEYTKLIQGINIPEKILNDLQYMADYVQIMSSKGTRSYLNLDIQMAKELRDDDDKVDDLFDTILNETTEVLAEKKDDILGMIYLIFIARSLERIADRIVNIGYRTIFIETNERLDIKEIKEEIK